MSKRGLIPRLFNYFTKVRGAERVNQECVGKDANGNQYFIKHAEGRAREARWVEPSEEVADHFHDELTMNVPQEWDAWLRKRRKDPPTEEEIEKNLIKQMKMREKVHRLKQLEQMDKMDSGDGEQTGLTQDITGDTTKRPFPKYKDFEISPGQMPSRFKTGD